MLETPFLKRSVLELVQADAVNVLREWVLGGLMGCDNSAFLPPCEMRPFYSSDCGLSLGKVFKLAIKESEREKVKLQLVLVTQLCLTLCDPMDCSPPGSSVQGVLQARILEWVAISFSRGSSRPRDQTPVSCVAGRVFTIGVTREERK